MGPASTERCSKNPFGCHRPRPRVRPLIKLHHAAFDILTTLLIRCGPKKILKEALMEVDPSYHYIGADIKAWDSETMQCDLANDNWPRPSVPVTMVAALGVLEYVEDYQGFFHRLRTLYNAEVQRTASVTTSCMPRLTCLPLTFLTGGHELPANPFLASPT